MDPHRSSPSGDPPPWRLPERTGTDDGWDDRERRTGPDSYDGFRVPAPRPGTPDSPPGALPFEPQAAPVSGADLRPQRAYEPERPYPDPPAAVGRHYPADPFDGPGRAGPPPAPARSLGPVDPLGPPAAAPGDHRGPGVTAPGDLLGPVVAAPGDPLGPVVAARHDEAPAARHHPAADRYPGAPQRPPGAAHPMEVPTGPVATVPPPDPGFIPGLNPVHHATESIDRSALRRPVGAPAPVGDGVYRARRPALLVGFLAVAALLEIPALRLLFTATFGPAVYPAGVVSGVLLVLALPVLAWGLAALLGGAGRLPDEPPARAWARAPLALLPVGLVLLVAAGLAAG
ncbi:MAG TPA: hypothetical protein VNV66_20250 [Pilimelia sp.]|nr:hypothetical protein [Pilimelia sp.]